MFFTIIRKIINENQKTDLLNAPMQLDRKSIRMGRYAWKSDRNLRYRIVFFFFSQTGGGRKHTLER